MVLEAEALEAVAVADRPTEVEAATEAKAATEDHRDPTAMHHPLVTALLQTCISRLRMAVVTRSSSLSTACPRKVFQNQTVPVATAVTTRFESMLTVS